MRLGKKAYIQMGKVLASKYPDIATEILNTYLHTNRVDEDLTHIPAYLIQFNEFVDHQQFGRLQLRKFFFSAMIRIYNPSVYQQPKNDLVMLSGFVSKLAVLFNMNVGNTSRLIKQVILDESIYDDYRLQVDSIVNHILSLKQPARSAQ